MKHSKTLLGIFFTSLMCLASNYHVQDSWHTDSRHTPKLLFSPSFQNDGAVQGEELARAYLTANHSLFGLQSDLYNLKLEQVKESLLGVHYTFQQTLNGIAVKEGSIVISISLRDGNIYQVYNNTYPEDSGFRTPAIILSEDDAFDIAWQDLAVHGDIMAQPSVKPYYIFDGKHFQLVYETFLGIEAPFGYFIHQIDAVTGEIREVRDGAISRNPQAMDYKKYRGPTDDREAAFRLYEKSRNRQNKFQKTPNASGTGLVFDPDPRTTLEDASLQDASPASAFTGAYLSRPLNDITENAGVYSLTGPWVYISDFESPNTAPSTTSDGNWTAERGDNAFNDAVVYFHIDQNQRYIQSLGFTGAKGIQEGSIEADSDGLNGQDNSHYIPSTNQLAWGHGCVDDSEDVFVILHEYGHAIQHDIQPVNWGGGDTGAMGEGFGDYWAGSYKYSTPNGPTFHPEWAFAWDGHGTGELCWPGRILNALGAQYVHTTYYTAHTSIPGGYQSDELWSTPLFQALLEIVNQGGTREEVDSIILESHFGIGYGLKMRDMANATITTADLLYPGDIHAGILIQKFLDHNIIDIHIPVLEKTGQTISNSGLNGSPDPGETFNLSVNLTNTGSVAAINISSNLTTTTPLVTILQANSNYPDLGIGESADNLTDFEIDVDPTFYCGQVIDFNLELQYDDGTRSVKHISFQIGTGVPQGAAQQVSPGLAIENLSSISSNMVISGTGVNVSSNFNIDIDITHTYIGDLIVSLESPSGTTVTLHNRSGGAAQNIVGNYPVTLSPTEPLSNFLCEPLDGTWTLHVSDNATGDTGTLNSWTIHDFSGYSCDENPTCAGSDLAVNAGNDQIACNSIPIMLHASGQGGLPEYVYKWDNGCLLDDTTSATPTATVSTTTTFTVTITDNIGCTRTDQVTLYVHDTFLPFLEKWDQEAGSQYDLNDDHVTNILDLCAWINQCN